MTPGNIGKGGRKGDRERKAALKRRVIEQVTSQSLLNKQQTHEEMFYPSHIH